MVDTHLLKKDNIVNLDTFLDDNYLSSKQITNCITKIPQNVILELNNGILTLKAGSKVYVPNGSGTFTTITTSSDMTMFNSSITYTDTILLCTNGTALQGARFGGLNTIGSGTLANRPAVSSMSLGAGLYYATDENKLYSGNKSANTWTAGESLPIAIVQVTSGTGVTSIDQVFNGFGYIGSTLFALPGIEGLIPNGRNDDGTLKSIKTSITDVHILDFPVANLSNATLFCGTSSLTVVTKPIYDSDGNFNYNSTTKWMGFPVAKYSTNSETKITSLVQNIPLHCVDYSEFNEVNKRLSSVESNYLTTDTTQTLTGYKTINRSESLRITIPGLDNNSDAPETNKYGVIRCLAQDLSEVGLISFNSLASGESVAYLTSKKKVDGVLKRSDLLVFVDSNGNSFVRVPTPNTETNTVTENKVATTNWVNARLNTNRGPGLLSIPQDVKLTISSGCLVRKAGSKFYIPSGFESDGTTPKFDVVTITQDQMSNKPTATNSELVYIYLPSSPSNFSAVSKVCCFSGATAPTGYTTMFWYDTTTNLMKLTTNSGSNWYSGFSLPYCIASTTASDGFVSIDQVFNGFSYIGKTVFSLSGVEGLMANGRNADGSLATRYFKTDKVIRAPDTVNTVPNYYNFYYSGNNLLFNRCNKPITSYDAVNNKYVRTDGNTLYTYSCIGVEVEGTTTLITKFTPRKTIQMFNSADIAKWSMPSNSYKDLTLATSGTSYTAPANGWFCLAVDKGTSTTAYVRMINVSKVSGIVYQDARAYGTTSDSPLRVSAPVQAGHKVCVEYNYTGTFQYFRFVYAEGDA